ncbi:anti-sigma factor RsiW [Nocardioides cavernae]|uniref:Regulator of SigK n=1 Tax=Nocardioides cavernae TaxID=1921566 RepID=A0A7Y9H399_9ACTN|nr:anti-sigma factor [Nocardioides cavernae]NYE37080.1 anti-sigma factor RsiW [Nocardioides cavernae]
MSHAEPDQLAGLALDPDDASEAVREHAQTCPECAALVAAFTGTRRRAGADALVAPPAHVRDRVLADVRAPAPPTAPPPVVVRERRGVPAWLAAVAAALALVAGIGLGRIGTGETPAPEASDPTPVETDDGGEVVAATALTALDSDAERGEASVTDRDDVITLRVRARDLGDEDGFHEVWLINVDGKRMVGVGILADGDDGEFKVPRHLIDDGYRIVDISVEPDDGDPTHSGVSLARGELA